MIELNNVTFCYGNEDEGFGSETGVKNIQMTVKTGECVVLCGRSGSGKSTILRLIGGLAPNFYTGSLAGEVTVGGLNPSDLLPEERTRLLGVVFQDPRSQFFMENVRDELAFSAENLGLAPDEIIRLIEKQADLIGVSHLLGRSLNKLSSGQKQRVAIAAASVLSPPLLILDEPTANLDHRGTQTLNEMLVKLKQAGTTLLISEHRLHSLLPVVDSFVCMEKGTIVRTWSKDEFSQLAYEDVCPYGLRHPDMINIGSTHILEDKNEAEAFEGRKLTYRYNKNGDGIEDVDIVLPKRSVTALTGGNGAGKTTLCKILCGLLRQRRGTIYNREIPLSAGRRRTSSYFVMQDADYQLYADSVGNEIVLGRHLDETMRLRAYEAMEAFGLKKLEERHPASLSGGEKQRVTMAAAYCSEAELIVLDEPTSGLDGDGVLKVAAWVNKLAQAGKTIVIITHDRILSDLACNQIIELKNESNEGEILKNNKKTVTSRLLEFSGEKSRL
ncbi:ABC transporter ATP-binding protein [Paenibacillus sp.]|jgi:energy-coupling factor transport system ATP-binding protein|uniref:ABC transporter ATP-binding protein n=1 Tax=Paenibacillus sp. TaxID=58172 RepID=UPI00282B2F7C|nr:ABC transporter ATP-binding protein [Paenibacillus sp.]MDR0270434.1 ABC transporter ATP-binding protein [Paenibacillus sp.]